jgi:hypothetical protein
VSTGIDNMALEYIQKVRERKGLLVDSIRTVRWLLKSSGLVNGRNGIILFALRKYFVSTRTTRHYNKLYIIPLP